MLGLRLRESGLYRQAPTVLVLAVIFGLAWFLRSYFAWGLAAPNGILSGGSDSFYYERIVRYGWETGHHIVFDPLLNYPTGLVNPRPPMFAWFTIVVGSLFAPFTADGWSAVSAVFLLSTSFWGALTIFPTYLLARDAFGRRAGIIAAFLLAVLPAHLQRSPATNADHDSFILFFVVTGFYFFLKALEGLNEKKWVATWSWKERKAVVAGLREFVVNNRSPLLYSMLSGWCMSMLALTWQGWAYAPVIVLVYFLFQIFVHRLRNQDTLGITACFAVAQGLPLLIAAPFYFPFGYVGTWYDVPAYLFLVALVLGIAFSVTRDLPWALVTPTIIGLVGAGFIVLSIVNPAVAARFLSGAGYFVRSKAYDTIAEAQAPGLSQAILSFGVASYYFSLVGLALMALQFATGKNTRPYYLFALVWSFAAIFMSMAAARFIFNAAPAFVVTAAYVIVRLFEYLNFEGAARTFLSVHGGRFGAFRKSVKIGHILGAPVIVLLIITPNVFYATDAAIPYESKKAYDQALYEATPEILRPPGYARVADGGGTFYLGAFGFSLPLEHDFRHYYPEAWDWLASQDADVTPGERPAFLSWWDYGFEAIDKGQHPSVADNFLDGYHLAGNFIAAQGEAEGIAYLTARLIEGDYRKSPGLSGGMRTLLASHGLDADLISESIRDARPYFDDILADPIRYGKRDSDLQPTNAMYIIIKTNLLERLPTADQQAGFYREVRELTGKSIRYFAVDSRLFPSDGESTGIFYAPIKLSDHRITQLKDGRAIPTDFFGITAVTNRGEFPAGSEPADAQVSDLKIDYKPMFYESMFYRSYVGFRPTQGGANADDGIPGRSGSAQSLQPMPAWNLTHWRTVYYTSYFNPYPQAEANNHPEASVPVNYADGIEIQKRISAGTETGTVYLSPANAIGRGVVFVKYYDGAFVNGTVTVDGTTPLPGARVTVSDEIDIPHGGTFTDAQGRYSLLAPFGEVRVTASLGVPDGRTLIGSTILNQSTFTVSDAAAMRQGVDDDSDGVPDWLIHKDLQARGQAADAVVFIDSDGGSDQDPGERLAAGAVVELRHNQTRSFTATFTANDDGRFRATGLIAGTYFVNVTFEGRRIALAPVTPQPDGEMDLGLPVAAVSGFVLDPAGQAVPGARIEVEDTTLAVVRATTADSRGRWSLSDFLSGPYNASASSGSLVAARRFFTVSTASPVVVNLTAYASVRVSGRTTAAGQTLPLATLEFQRVDLGTIAFTVSSDGNGRYEVALPVGRYRVAGRHYSGTTVWAFGEEREVRGDSTATMDFRFEPATLVEGTVYTRERQFVQTRASVEFRNGATIVSALANHGGSYTAFVPQGAYDVTAFGSSTALARSVSVQGTRMALDLNLAEVTQVPGSVYEDLDRDARKDPLETDVPGVTVAFTSAAGTFRTLTGADGKFLLPLPPGTYTPSFSRFGWDSFTDVPGTVGTLAVGLSFPLRPSDIPVSGRVFDATGPLVDIPIEFAATGGGAVGGSAVSGLDGRYTLDLRPGDYNVSMQVVSGGSSRQLAVPVALGLAFGDLPRTLDLLTVTRHSVGGVASLSNVGVPATVSITGPDPVNVTAAADGSFNLFLAEGQYNAIARYEQDGIRYGAIQEFTVDGPEAVAVDLRRTVEVRGRVLHGGAPVSSAVEILFTLGGASDRVTATQFGSYELSVLPGDYVVSIDSPAAVTESGAIRHVRYTLTLPVTVPAGAFFNLDLEVARALDNATVRGRASFGGAGVPASIEFRASGAQGLSVSTGADVLGDYSVSIAAGNYSVYALYAPLRAVHLGSVEVTPRSTTTLDLALQAAVQVSGVLEAAIGDGRQAVAGTVTFTANGALEIATASGPYSALLPPGDYELSGSASIEERGSTVTFSGSASLSLADDRLFDLLVSRKATRTVALSWDASERRTVSQGGSVVYSFTVKNTGNADDTYELSASVAGWTFTFTPTKVALPFGSTGNAATVSVTIRAPSDATVDHPALTISARSTVDPTVRGSTTVTVDVARVRGLTLLRGATAPAYDGGFLNHTLAIRNTGNAQEMVRVELLNPNDLANLGWQARFLRTATGTPELLLENLTVAANATVEVTLRLQRLSPSPTAGFVVLSATEMADPGVASNLRYELVFPDLVPSGEVRAFGVATYREAPLDWPLISILIALASVAGLGFWVYWEGRKRR